MRRERPHGLQVKFFERSETRATAEGAYSLDYGRAELRWRFGLPPWNANPRDIYGTPGPYEDAIQNTPIFEENGPDKFKGIDIMRAVRSFDPCLPCGVHMNDGDTKLLETRHMPMFGAQGSVCATGDK